MFTRVSSGGVRGIGGFIVSVEADVSTGMPSFDLVGFLGSEVREAQQRVRTALKNSGYALPVARITVNLAPADIRKSGTCYDLPIALAILACMGEVPAKSLEGLFVAGELMLSGKIAATKGILPMILEAKRLGYKRFLIPSENHIEGAMVEGVKVYGVDTLIEAVGFIKGDRSISPYESILKQELCKPIEYAYDFSNVKGQLLARRGIEIGVAGLHNVMMIGPPGAGKTMLSKSIPSIMPPLSERECLEITSIYSVKGQISKESGLITRRPFVTAHHTSTDVSLIGGGNVIRPGAVSMAHNGVLFLDEIPEFSRKALEALRQPLEDRNVNITRNRDVCTFPASFMLVAAMNPCPCGYFPDRAKCYCTDAAREKYMSKISGPLMDRIDICITTQKVSLIELNNYEKAESSEDIRARVVRAHDIQSKRFKGRDISFNSQMDNHDIERFCKLKSEENDFIKSLSEKYDISARSYYRILKIARTIADIAEEESISVSHLKEAVRFKLGG